MLRFIFRHDVFMDKILRLFICRGEGKTNTKNGEAMMLQKSTLPTYFPSLSSTWASNSQQECGDTHALTHSCCHNQLTVSLFDIFYWGEEKKNTSRDWAHWDKMDLSDEFKHCTGLCNKTKQDSSGIWERNVKKNTDSLSHCCLFFT